MQRLIIKRWVRDLNKLYIEGLAIINSQLFASKPSHTVMLSHIEAKRFWILNIFRCSITFSYKERGWDYIVTKKDGKIIQVYKDIDFNKFIPRASWINPKKWRTYVS